jgi:hypothetical protein
MTMQDQIQTSSRPNPTLRQTLHHKTQASSTVDKASRVAGQPRCGVVVVVLLMVVGRRGLGGTCSPDAADFEPSPQIELGGSLTSGGNLTRQQRCNHNSNHIDPMTEIQA